MSAIVTTGRIQIEPGVLARESVEETACLSPQPRRRHPTRHHGADKTREPYVMCARFAASVGMVGLSECSEHADSAGRPVVGEPVQYMIPGIVEVVRVGIPVGTFEEAGVHETYAG